MFKFKIIYLFMAKMKKHSIEKRERDKRQNIKEGMARQNILTRIRAE
jgi:hypothetical protein